jgi:phospholipase C
MRALASAQTLFLLVGISTALLLFGPIPRVAQHRSFVADARSKIRHVVIIVQENRSFDNLFHGYPGADTASFGYAHDGTRVELQPISLKAPYDISNGFRDFMRSFNYGRMDGYDLRTIGPLRGDNIPLNAAQYPTFTFVRRADVQPYFDMASQYVLSDRMFQSNIDQSFAAHLYLIAGHAGHAANVPDGRPWGCDAYHSTRVVTLTKYRAEGRNVFPCFDFPTLGDELAQRGLPWRYYAPALSSARSWEHFISRHANLSPNNGGPEFGQLWTAYDAVAHDRYGPSWISNIVSPPSQFLRDAARGQLASVTWIVPDWKNSDHALSKSDTGPSWVVALVNAIGQSRFWNDTAIFVVWDDSGGWYDHVAPPQLDYDGLGVRVPLIIVSPFAKHGYVSHVQHEFGSILRFAEEVYRLPALAESDRRADDFQDAFNFKQPPRRFVPIAAKYSAARFLGEAPSVNPPDNQ